MKSGVVALRMAARPLSICVWPQLIRAKGMALLSRPIPKNANQADLLPGILMPSALTSTFRITAANPTRSNTIVKGGNVLIRTPPKKKEPPHRTDSSSSMSHSPLFMRLLIEGWVAIWFRRPLTLAIHERRREPWRRFHSRSTSGALSGTKT